MKKLTKIMMILIGIGLYSCNHPTDVSGIQEVCFEKEILPIFQSNCTMSGCHGTGDKESEEFNASTYEGIMEEITPYSLEDSEAYSALTNSYEIMPPSPNTPLSKEQRTLIAVWILQGAKNTTCK